MRLGSLLLLFRKRQSGRTKLHTQTNKHPQVVFGSTCIQILDLPILIVDSICPTAGVVGAYKCCCLLELDVVVAVVVQGPVTRNG